MTAKKKNIHSNTLFSKKIIILGMLPGMLLYIVFFVIPSMGTVLCSFTDISNIPGQSIHFLGLDNYKEFLLQSNKRDLLQIFSNTMKYCFITTIVQTIIALILAEILCKKFVKGKTFYRAIIFLPTILGVTVTGLCFKLIFSNNGLAANILSAFGTRSGMFSDAKVALYLVIFCQIWASVGYEMTLFIAGIQNIPEDYMEAARVDGAGKYRIFFSITLPQLWDTLTTNILMCVIGALSSFQIILVTTGGTPATKTLSMYIYQIAFGMGNVSTGTSNIGRQGYAAAMQVILFLIIFVFIMVIRTIMQKFYKES